LISSEVAAAHDDAHSSDGDMTTFHAMTIVPSVASHAPAFQQFDIDHPKDHVTDDDVIEEGATAP
jgi:hypothetical protein